ncbi:hypothetical protein [Bacteroides pyogenes]|uniref:hypothetical protein n=1 Tax=Bacteroides pyogenes TaxID=310300 RepID=UPI002A91B4C8|nr:hypothetical protein [Bacteroides pyogenes]MDY5433704.1 hypothetical protein [Bacteroides pyogenes]
MGKKHLSEDELKYIISAETTKAQKELYDLSKATKHLRAEERQRRQAMIELEAQGKKNSKEYANLKNELKDYTKRIAENIKKEETLRSSLDINAMSMSQLRKQSKHLRRELEDVSKALDPERYAQLEKQVKNVDRRINELRVSAKSISEIATTPAALGAMAGIVSLKIAEKAGELLKKMKEIAAEGVEMAASADGVKHAFDKLDDGSILQDLRRATKDTVTDLDLMKAVVRAKDFRIPFEDLGKYLQFAQMKAQQTGQSVEYMTDSIIAGLGRKSVMILDNLGLSAAEINEEVAKTGDFMSAVASIVDKQLAAAGENYVSSADRAQAATVRFKNAQLELGQTLLPLKEDWDELYTGVMVTFMNLTGWAVKHRRIITLLISAYTAYIATQKIATLWNAKHASSTMLSVAAEKLHTLHLALSRKAFLTKIIVMDLYRGRCNLATAATEMFNLVLKKTPVGLVASLLATAATAFFLFKSKVDPATSSINELNKRLRTERTELNNLFDEMKKTNPGTTERIRLIDQLKERYPGLLSDYGLETASLKEITRAQNEANTALTNRIATEMKAQSVSDYVKENISEQIELEERLLRAMRKAMGSAVFNKLKSGMTAFLRNSNKDIKDFTAQFGKYADMSVKKQALFVAGFHELRAKQKGLSSGIEEINQQYAPYIKSLKTVVTLSAEEMKKQVEATSLIKKLEKEKEKVQNTWAEDTEKNLALKNKELERLDKEIRKLKELGTVKSSLKKQDANKEQEKQIATEKAAVQSLEKLREDSLRRQQHTYNSFSDAFNSALSENRITKEQHEMLMLQLEKENADARLKIEQTYYQDAQSMALTDAETKEDVIRKMNGRVIDAQKEVNNRTAAMQAKLSSLVKDFKEQFKVTTVDEDYSMQLKTLQAAYEARKEMAEKQNLDSTELDKAYYRAKEQLEYEHQQRLQSIRDQYGLSTQKERLDAELEQLRNARDEGLLTEEEHEQAVQNLKRDSFKKQFDYYSKLFSSAVQSLQQAEMDNIDAQYDAEIEAARGNAEEVERLEQEKAQKKLDVQKKYADINFAVKASQIIADTAVSVMRALADLGPVAGPIAAALMSATGLAQLASANAEREKVKSMTLSGGSSSGGSGARVATGRESGGKIDVRRAQDGKFFPGADYDPHARGFIDRPTVIVGEGPSGHSREWVASNAAVDNPTVAPILDILDKSQQAGTIRTLDLNKAIRARMAGYASGGSIAPAPPQVVSVPQGNAPVFPPHLMEKLARSIIRLDERGIPASVTLTDIDRKRELRERSRNVGSKQ